MWYASCGLLFFSKRLCIPLGMLRSTQKINQGIQDQTAIFCFMRNQRQHCPRESKQRIWWHHGTWHWSSDWCHGPWCHQILCLLSQQLCDRVVADLDTLINLQLVQSEHVQRYAHTAVWQRKVASKTDLGRIFYMFWIWEREIGSHFWLGDHVDQSGLPAKSGWQCIQSFRLSLSFESHD